MAIGQEAKRFEVRLWVISGHSCDRCPLYLRKANIQNAKDTGRAFQCSLQRKKNYIGSSPGFTRCGRVFSEFPHVSGHLQTGSKFSVVGSNHFIDSIQFVRSAAGYDDQSTASFSRVSFFRFVNRILAFRWFVQHILPKKHRDSSRSRSSWECCLLRQSIMSRVVQEPGISIATPVTWFPLEHVNTNVRLTTPVQNAYVFHNCRASLYRAQ